MSRLLKQSAYVVGGGVIFLGLIAIGWYWLDEKLWGPK